jgi:hypothetical protein
MALEAIGLHRVALNVAIGSVYLLGSSAASDGVNLRV